MQTLVNTVDGRFPSFRFCLLFFKIFSKQIIYSWLCDILFCDILILKLNYWFSVYFNFTPYDPTRDQFHTFQVQKWTFTVRLCPEHHMT